MFLPRFLMGARPDWGNPAPRSNVKVSSFLSSQFSPTLFGLGKQCRAGIPSQPGFIL